MALPLPSITNSPKVDVSAANKSGASVDGGFPPLPAPAGVAVPTWVWWVALGVPGGLLLVGLIWWAFKRKGAGRG